MRGLPGLAASMFYIAALNVQADCVDRVADTQAQIAELLAQPLTTREHAELSAVLYQLCESRPVGASVVEDADRTARTTHGLNPREPRPENEQPAIIAVDVDGKRRYRDGDRRQSP